MAITLVQKNGSASTGTLNAAPPAWSVTPTAGNLLLIVGCEVQNTNSTWPTTPAGYTAFASTPFGFYTAGTEGAHGLYWKIAGAGEATPGHYGETSGTQDWVTYTYEFANSGGGWIAAAADREVHSAASSTTGTTKASGSTATLSQANELAICLLATSVVVTAGAFSGGFSLAQPTTSNGKLFVGWQATAATTALATTATWITSARAGVKIATFKAAASGTVFTQSVTAAALFAGSAPVKASARRLPAAVSFAGTRSSSPKARITQGSFAPVGSIAKQQSLLRSITGSLSFTGARNASMTRTVTGSLSFTGVRTSIKSVSKAVSGALTFSGASSRFPAKVLTGGFTPSGAVSRIQTLARTLSSTLTPTGSFAKRTNRLFSGVQRPVGMVVTAGRGALSAVFRPTAGAVTHSLPSRTFFAALQATGSVARFTARQFLSGLIATGLVNTRFIPPVEPTPPGGGGFGAVMHDSFFQRYEVDAKWRHMKRVRVK